MLSLRTTAITQQTVHRTEAIVAATMTDQLVWGEFETTPWEGLHDRSTR